MVLLRAAPFIQQDRGAGPQPVDCAVRTLLIRPQTSVCDLKETFTSDANPTDFDFKREVRFAVYGGAFPCRLHQRRCTGNLANGPLTALPEALSELRFNIPTA
jgi:hypothetical protein